MRIPFADFTQMHSEIQGELSNAFKNVLETNYYISGVNNVKFEDNFSKYIGVKYCVGCGNGLDALTLALKSLGIGVGDEVIVPANSFIATALAVTQTGAIPVFADCKIDTFNIDPKEINKHISEKTKAIIPVHLYGQPAEMDPILEIAKKYSLYVIEDTAQAHGALYKGKKVGSLGVIGAFSFYPGKNLGALGDAGGIVTNNKSIFTKLKALGNYGAHIKYDHEYLGQNSRLDEMQAAFLNIKLTHLDKWNSERIRIAKRYLNGIKNEAIILPKCIDEASHVFHIFAIRSEKRDELEKYLREKGIETNKHYPIPIHLQKCYKELGYKCGDYPNAELISRTELSLPLYYGMTDNQIDYVIQAINDF